MTSKNTVHLDSRKIRLTNVFGVRIPFCNLIEQANKCLGLEGAKSCNLSLFHLSHSIENTKLFGLKNNWSVTGHFSP